MRWSTRHTFAVKGVGDLMRRRARMTQPSIVVIDNYYATRSLIEEVLSAEGYVVRCYSDRQVDSTWVELDRPDLLIVDLERDQPEHVLFFLAQLRQHPATNAIPVIVTSTDRRLLYDLDESLRQLGCMALEKPFGLDELLDDISRALPARQARRLEGSLIAGVSDRPEEWTT
jgi:CheY-like chemotaxis protein